MLTLLKQHNTLSLDIASRHEHIGSVYKTQLQCVKVAALKKFHSYETKVPSFDVSFRNEVGILSGKKHISIVKLYGFCLHKRIICFLSINT